MQLTWIGLTLLCAGILVTSIAGTRLHTTLLLQSTGINAWENQRKKMILLNVMQVAALLGLCAFPYFALHKHEGTSKYVFLWIVPILAIVTGVISWTWHADLDSAAKENTKAKAAIVKVSTLVNAAVLIAVIGHGIRHMMVTKK